MQHHHAGRLRDAEALFYRRILARDPENARAMHLLGVIAHQSGHLPDALSLIRRSIELRPDAADLHNNLGNVLAAMGNKAQAASAFRAAVAIHPDAVITHRKALKALIESKAASKQMVTAPTQSPRK